MKADSSTDRPDIDKVRDLLVGAEMSSVREWKAWREDPKSFNNSIANSISEAISIRSERDDSVARALGNTIEQSLTESVKNNPEPLADALYPIMGPAIRRSITETMNQTLENFNRVLENSLSPRSLKWRIQALISGKDFAEVALLHSLDYQVEQVFLIHRETSLLLRHAFSESAVVRDGDMVSSMLSAIQDFVSDSFSVETGDTLNTLRLGELTVCIAAGPEALIAAVVRGSVPVSLRTLMHETIEAIHRRFAKELQDWQGDSEPFAPCEALLNECLVGSYHNDEMATPKQTRNPGFAIVALVFCACLVGYYLYSSHQYQTLIDNTVASLDDHPGIVIIQAEEHDGELKLVGLKDPLTPPIEHLIPAEAQKKLTLKPTMHPWHSLDTDLVKQRVAATMQSMPDSIEYKLSDGELTLTGLLDNKWAASSLIAALQIPGVDSLNLDGLTQLEPKAAPPVVAAALPDLSTMAKSIEQYRFYYSNGATEIDAASLKAVTTFVSAIKAFSKAAHLQGLSLRGNVLGYSDRSGGVNVNRVVSEKRANAFARLLNQENISGAQFLSTGMGSVSQEQAMTMDNPRHVRMVVMLIPSVIDEVSP